MFAMFLLFGYYGKLGDYIIWILFLFPIFLTDLQVHSTLLLTRGRSQRYIMAMSRLIFTTITTMGFIFIGLGLTKIVEPYMPAIHVRSFISTTFHAPDWHRCSLCRRSSSAGRIESFISWVSYFCMAALL
jgi:hypothetical protein